jgi:preprotein translocase subunit Sec63
MSGEFTITEKPIQFFATSKEFQEMCEKNGFENLGSILELHVNEMLQRSEFNHRMLKELYQILDSCNLTGKIKET